MVSLSSQDENILEAAAKDGTIDASQWPGLLDRMLPRLDYIVHNEFSIPFIPQPEPLTSITRNDVSGLNHEPSATPPPSSQQSQKENAPPGGLSTPRPTTSLRSTSSPPSQQMIPNSQPSSISAWPSTLPSELVALFTAIQRTLTSQFPTSPPYTIQRLAELVLRPCSHYRTLPSYLRALDRVLSVSSTADAFPLPLIATNGPTENGHGTTYLASGGPSLHSNDFNGAALTRIPWLRDPSSVLINTERPLTGDLRTESTSLIDGPNGAGSLETVTVSVNGMTSATAQRAGLGINSSSDPLHPASDGPSSGRMTRSGTASALARREEEADEERVHARGPDEMTMEDMGPQASDRVGQAFDVEAALGRPGEGEDMVVAEVEGEMRESDAGVDMYSRHRGDNTGAGTEMDEGTGADGQQNLVDTSAL